MLHQILQRGFEPINPSYKSVRRSRDSLVSIVTRLQVGQPGFNSWQGFFSSPLCPNQLLGPTHPPIQWVPGALSPGVKQSGHKADNSHPFSSKVKNTWMYTSTPPYVVMVWCLSKHRIHPHGMILKLNTGATLPLPLINQNISPQSYSVYRTLCAGGCAVNIVAL
jgi:hypothetical protein